MNPEELDALQDYVFNYIKNEELTYRKAIVEKFRKAGFGNEVSVPYVQDPNLTFTASYPKEGVYYVSVSVLGAQHKLPLMVFDVVQALLHYTGGRAQRGNATNYKLGHPKLPFDSVEGCVARIVFNKDQGDSVFRRITPICCLLIWAGVCKHARGELLAINS